MDGWLWRSTLTAHDGNHQHTSPIQEGTTNQRTFQTIHHDPYFYLVQSPSTFSLHFTHNRILTYPHSLLSLLRSACTEGFNNPPMVASECLSRRTCSVAADASICSFESRRLWNFNNDNRADLFCVHHLISSLRRHCLAS
jgi:hypothetical protein